MAEDRIEGLDRGADDYLGKPFDLGELAARLRALVRRANGRTEPSVTIGPFAITLATRQVTLNGKEIELSRRAFAVLDVLVRHPGGRKSVVAGKSVSVRVDLGGRRIITKQTTTTDQVTLAHTSTN